MTFCLVFVEFLEIQCYSLLITAFYSRQPILRNRTIMNRSTSNPCLYQVTIAYSSYLSVPLSAFPKLSRVLVHRDCLLYIHAALVLMRNI